MRPDHEWVAVQVDVPVVCADAVANFLVEGGAAGVGLDEGADRVRLQAHVRRGEEAALVPALERYLASLAAIEPGWRHGPIEVVPVPSVDWDAVFRSHHHPIEIGSRLLVAPPWDIPPAPGREVLVIEPGMAFGTGQHATTRTCLEEVEAAVLERRPRSALDVGTGSGVLAAALARLGVARVVALDVDPAVLPLARANLARNGAVHVLLVGGTVAAVRGTYDLVIANILADTIVVEAAALAARVAPGGRLVLAGILDSQSGRVVTAFPGWRCVHVRAEDPWRTLRLAREVE
ncbi:MAG TPA: 50S ribosomal protein L11 methyltransferase [Candidatus Eisenbacteria bacterium]|nr:50S ribosomal protein L11 methyltransferase [Candidatus Eisenbacteria bacterium]